MATRAPHSSAGFWTFVTGQLARPLVHDGSYQREVAQEALVLSYLREVAGSEQDALGRLLSLGVFGPGRVRLAACRLYRRWQSLESTYGAVA